jgi:hypothetical protein
VDDELMGLRAVGKLFVSRHRQDCALIFVPLGEVATDAVFGD